MSSINNLVSNVECSTCWNKDWCNMNGYTYYFLILKIHLISDIWDHEPNPVKICVTIFFSLCYISSTCATYWNVETSSRVCTWIANVFVSFSITTLMWVIYSTKNQHVFLSFSQCLKVKKGGRFSKLLVQFKLKWVSFFFFWNLCWMWMLTSLCSSIIFTCPNIPFTCLVPPYY